MSLPRPHFVRRLYDWVLAWAEHPWGASALFLLAVAESSFFPIPPDVLLVALAVGAPSRAFRFAAICTAGSVLGGMAGYAIGWGLWEGAGTKQFFFDYIPGFTPEAFAQVHGLYETWNFWIVFVAAFTPIPYKVITVTAGAFGIDFPVFVVASFVGRAGRFFLVAALLWKFGAPIKRTIDRYFDLIAIVFTLLLIGGFVLIKMVL